MKIDFKKLKQVHFVGIGGIGVSAVAKMMLHQGVRVGGSDATKSEITEDLEKRGAEVNYGHRLENVRVGTNLLIYSAAAPANNPEREEARKRNIPELSYFEFLGELSRDYFTIAISGTNGKSTTTALIGLMLEAAGLDPTVIVGSKVKTFPDGNLRLGKSKYLVLEACEYQAHMLKIHPHMIVLTNIEEDHLDYYRDLEHIKQTFKKYVASLPKNGTLIHNADDAATNEIVNQESPRESKHGTGQARIPAREQARYGAGKNQELSYGIFSPSDYTAKNILVDSERQYFDLFYSKELIGNFTMQIPGRFNIYNGLAAAALGFALDIDYEIVKRVLGQFPGIWRRYERVGESNGALVISDYGHHPTAIRETIQASRDFFPQRRIVLVFQPHQRNRTRKLFNEFVEALQSSDILILTEIYDVTGREDRADADVSSRELFDVIKKKYKECYFASDLVGTEELARKLIKPDDLVIVMGAGDIDKVARKLAKD